MDKWINAIGVIAQVIIAFCALFLLYISSQDKLSRWWGIRNFYVNFFFAPDHSKRDGSAFAFYIYNKGTTPQIYCSILNERGRHIGLYDFNSLRYKIMRPMRGEHFFIYITPSFIKTLEKSKSLFLVNNRNKKKKFASKKDIQRELKKYREHISKSAVRDVLK